MKRNQQDPTPEPEPEEGEGGGGVFDEPVPTPPGGPIDE